MTKYFGGQKMIKESKLFALSIIVLAISVLLGSLWIGFSLRNIDVTYNVISDSPEELNEVIDRGLITETEAAQYLSLELDELNAILQDDIMRKKGLRSYDTYRFIPYLELENGKKLFNKIELDKWIDYNL